MLCIFLTLIVGRVGVLRVHLMYVFMQGIFFFVRLTNINFCILNHRYIVVYPVYLSRERSIEQVGGSSNNLNKMITTSKERMVSAFYTLLIRDSIHLVIATFCICLTERNSIREDPLNFSIFNIAFEIVRYVFFKIITSFYFDFLIDVIFS